MLDTKIDLLSHSWSVWQIFPLIASLRATQEGEEMRSGRVTLQNTLDSLILNDDLEVTVITHTLRQHLCAIFKISPLLYSSMCTHCVQQI